MNLATRLSHRSAVLLAIASCAAAVQATPYKPASLDAPADTSRTDVQADCVPRDGHVATEARSVARSIFGRPRSRYLRTENPQRETPVAYWDLSRFAQAEPPVAIARHACWNRFVIG